LAETVVTVMRAPYDLTLDNLYFAARLGGSGGSNITYTVYTGATVGSLAASTLAVTVASTAVLGDDTSNSVDVDEGELIAVAVDKAAALTSSPDNITVTMRSTPR